jgi:hypothetical protein
MDGNTTDVLKSVLANKKEPIEVKRRGKPMCLRQRFTSNEQSPIAKRLDFVHRAIIFFFTEALIVDSVPGQKTF